MKLPKNKVSPLLQFRERFVDHDRATISLSEDSRCVTVFFRYQRIGEGWWKREFERTPEGRAEAISLFEGFQC